MNSAFMMVTADCQRKTENMNILNSDISIGLFT